MSHKICTLFFQCSFAPTLKASLRQIAGYNTLLREIEALKKEAYCTANQSHEQSLMKVRLDRYLCWITVADPEGGAMGPCPPPPPPLKLDWLCFLLIPFCIKMLSNKAQIAREFSRPFTKCLKYYFSKSWFTYPVWVCLEGNNAL